MEIYGIILSYLLLFVIGGVCGWVIEFFFRRIVHKQWVNPGFLNGPLLPLYGFGVMVMYAVSSINIDWWWKIIIFLFALTLVEYLAGLIFIKGMGLKLWDYSDRWGNIQGIICPLFSLAWCAIGAIFLFLVYPPLHTCFTWFSNNIDFGFFLGIAYGIFIVDLGLSFHLSMKLRELAKAAKSVLPYEHVKHYIMEINKKAKRKFRFICPFRIDNFKETVAKYMDEVKAKMTNKGEKK